MSENTTAPVMQAMNGIRKKVGRETDDFYITPAEATWALLRAEPRWSPTIWEPACGNGAIGKVLEEAGHEVIGHDLRDRGYGVADRDFLLHPGMVCAPTDTPGITHHPDIITNPPFKLADEFARHAVVGCAAPKVAMLLRLAWLEGEGRRKALFSDLQLMPTRCWVFSRRITLWNGSDDVTPEDRKVGGAIPYAWFVWDSALPPTGYTATRHIPAEWVRVPKENA